MDSSAAAEDDDIDPSSMTTRMEFVKIEQLPAFVDKKTPVDIIGVVTGVGAFGSVKRKSDSTELQRRDLTMVDDGYVVLFLCEYLCSSWLHCHAEKLRN